MGVKNGFVNPEVMVGAGVIRVSVHQGSCSFNTHIHTHTYYLCLFPFSVTLSGNWGGPGIEGAVDYGKQHGKPGSAGLVPERDAVDPGGGGVLLVWMQWSDGRHG